MTMRRIFLILALCPLCAVLSANASPVVSRSHIQYERAGIQFDAPEGWHATRDSDEIDFVSPDGSAMVLLWMVEPANKTRGAQAIWGELNRMFTKLVVERGVHPVALNEFEALGASGRGKFGQEANVGWQFEILSAKQKVIMLFFSTPRCTAVDRSAFSSFLQSMHRIRDPR
jgi:hypothetical protein